MDHTPSFDFMPTQIPVHAQTQSQTQPQAMTASSSATQSDFTQNVLTPPLSAFDFDPMVRSFQAMQFSYPQNQGPIPGTPFDFVGPMNIPVFNPSKMTGNYGPAAAGAAVRNCHNAYARTIYIGGFPEGTDVDQVLSLVHFGPLEEIKVPKNGQCLFISFLNGAVAAAFLADAQVKKIAVRGNALNVNMAREQPWMSRDVLHAVLRDDATRTVYIPNIDPEMSEDEISQEMRAFGDVDIVKVVRNQQNAFVHFFSIKKAIEVVDTLRKSGKYCRDGKQVGFGKDRCAFVPKAQALNVETTMRQACMAAEAEIHRMHYGQMGAPDNTKFNTFVNVPTSPYFNANPNPYAQGQGHHTQYMGKPQSHTHANNQPKRIVYLGNIPEGATVEDLCNAIRGGNLQHIRYLPEKKCAFATFVEFGGAALFHATAQQQGVVVKGYRLRVGWGAKDDREDPSFAAVAGTGATRNVYVGGIKDFEAFTEEKLRADFEAFGEVEMINFLKEKAAAFVNFTSIAAAVKAIDQIQTTNPEYAGLHLNSGKDRCAAPPREFRHFNNRAASTRPEPMRNNAGPEGENQPAAPAPSGAKATEQGEPILA